MAALNALAPPDKTLREEDIGECKDEKSAYRRLKLLGEGSFGKAFLARDLATNELCVMKQIRVEKMDTKARETAVREAVALKKVRHANVVGFRQVFMRSGWLCLVMDFADGGDLCAAVKERAKAKVPFEESAVLECFGQCADAVHYVHSLKMVHRDIKSRNIFLCRTGRALLGDFGLVRLLEFTCQLAHTRVGTPYYLSPEIIRKQAYNYKTDTWSLGVLLYEMAALKRPFLGTLETLPQAILKGEYEPLGDHYSPGLQDLVQSMLRVDPAERLELAEGLAGDLMKIPLDRAKEALSLPAPAPIHKKPKGVEEIPPEPVAVDAAPAPAAAPAAAPAGAPAAAPAKPPQPEQPQRQPSAASSEWMGFNTMIRRAGDPPIMEQLAKEDAARKAAMAAASRPPEAAADPPARVPAQELVDAAGPGPLASMKPEDWSMAQQHDSGSEQGDSDGSFGEAVDVDLLSPDFDLKPKP